MWTLNARGKILTIDRPVIMGVMNRTPDSFYGGSRVADGEWMRQAARLLDEGADWLDIGGQSTRPGAEVVGAEEELRRLIPSIGQLRKEWPDIPLSVDTWHARVAEAAVAAGATMVNDVSGGQLDPAMLATISRLRVPYICMHMRGTPATMNQEAHYDDVVMTVLDYFIERIEACRRAGIHDVILDPGWGFAKMAVHNFRLLHGLSTLRICGKPLLLGLSRKSTIYRTLDVTAEAALNGTTVMHTLALMNGADIIRVHDPAAAHEVAVLVGAYKHANEKGR